MARIMTAKSQGQQTPAQKAAINFLKFLLAVYAIICEKEGGAILPFYFLENVNHDT